MNRATRAVNDAGMMRAQDVPALYDYAQVAARVGVTTSTDLSNALMDENVAALRAATAGTDFPLRLVPAMRQRDYSLEAGLARIAELKRQSTDKLHFGIVKITADGSIQGFTARLRWPGYHNGAPNGLWYVAPAEFGAIVEAYHKAGVQLHIHTNGDEASELATEMIGRAVTSHPRMDHRHTLQHCQKAASTSSPTTSGTGASSTPPSPWARAAPSASTPAPPRSPPASPWASTPTCR